MRKRGEDTVEGKKRDRGVAFVTAETTAFVPQRCRGTRATNVTQTKAQRRLRARARALARTQLVRFLLGRRMGCGMWRGGRREAEGRNQKVSTRNCSAAHKTKPPRKQTMTCVCMWTVTCFYVHETFTMDTTRLRLGGWYHYIKYRWHTVCDVEQECVLLQSQLCQ